MGWGHQRVVWMGGGLRGHFEFDTGDSCEHYSDLSTGGGAAPTGPTGRAFCSTTQGTSASSPTAPRTALHARLAAVRGPEREQVVLKSGCCKTFTIAGR